MIALTSSLKYAGRDMARVAGFERYPSSPSSIWRSACRYLLRVALRAHPYKAVNALAKALGAI